MILDHYFARPLFWDYLLGAIVCLLLEFAKYKGLHVAPENDTLISTTTDLSTISLTIAGFILTLLTVLITFKGSTVQSPNTENSVEPRVFDAFFETGLYYLTIKHLSNGIKSLSFIALIGYSLKLTLAKAYVPYMLYFGIFGLIIVVLTIWRSLLILAKIVALQREG
ncbi:hypothetical protein SAMN06265348_110268 [Pedobacter westerhofensis]|uniref:Uncharacterized protein n=1 Tax=Pedobacter westerhofensis TaxID=425512 RepID=A0A521F830_9SPHI|nr:hypothetical protein [Pedobacter westerhofensis]SMO92276.1 hypothetical protein SAMN06265348_110268 [Pedobacter westerhofensis]